MCEEIECEDQMEDTCNDELCNGTAYAFKYNEQPLCEDIACEDQTEGRYMTENKCKQNAKKYPGYPCNDIVFNGNNCVCISQEKPLCADIQYDDQQEDICKPKEERDKYMNDPKAIICNDEVCKGNDCVCSSEEQTLCKDIGCAATKEGRCITKEECDKNMTTSKGYTYNDDSSPMTATTDSTHVAKLSSNELRIFLRDPNIERFPIIKSSCKNIICNHKYSVKVVERSDIFCTEMTSPISITSKPKDHDESYILPINSQIDLSRSIRPNSEHQGQQSQSFVNIHSSGPMNTSEKYESRSKHDILKDVSTVTPIDTNLPKSIAPNQLQYTTKPNTRIYTALDNQRYVSHIHNNNCNPSASPSTNQYSVNGPFILQLNTYKKIVIQ